MTITAAQAQSRYKTAVRLLFDIGASPQTPPALRRAAKTGIEVLSHDFINQRLEQIDLRNEQIRQFIAEMEHVIEAAEGITPFQALERLTGLVDTTRTALEGGTEPSPD